MNKQFVLNWLKENDVKKPPPSNWKKDSKTRRYNYLQMQKQNNI